MRFLFYVIIIIIMVYWIRRLFGQNNSSESDQTSSANRYAKWIGGGVGWAFGGPIGALLGFAFGKMFDDMKQGTYEHKGTNRADFNVSLLILSAAVMRSDRQVKRSELDFVRGFFVRNFGQQAAEQYILMLREILKQDFDLREVCGQIRHYMDYSARLQLIHYLYGIANSDGGVQQSESEQISRISDFLGISQPDYLSIKAMFVQETHSAFRILEIALEATDEELKKAYREMAVKFHPDKVNHLGEEVRKAAEEKFRKINDAYEQIKRERGIK